MENQVNDMIRGLINFNKDRNERTVKDNRIFYKEGDGLSSKVHFGYRTIFAYYYEYNEAKTIDIEGFNNQIFISLIVASFSYSYLPRLFESILGVTGTLKSMSAPQQEFLYEDYGVKRQFVLPSIYPESNRKIRFQSVPNIKLYKALVESAKRESERNRPVIIFFKSKY